MIKLLLDTDIGTDVDDAVCLAYLLRHPACELLGIVTSGGEAEKRAALASILCRQAGRDIPIFPGDDATLAGLAWGSSAPQASILPRWSHQEQFPRGEAVAFLSRVLHSHPGEVLLLNVGPLTHTARLFRDDPQAASLLKGLVIMGGVFDPRSPEYERTEWNLASDPQAAQVVYCAPRDLGGRLEEGGLPRLHRSLGLDVTQQVVMGMDEVRRRFRAPHLQPVMEMAEIWFSGFYPAITFHDPLAAAAIFRPDLFTWADGQISMDRSTAPGRAVFTGAVPGPHQVAQGVDIAGYFAHLAQILDLD